jgi:uncharacterized protein YbgA (DUF1722 family)/uncharacterized protein YbbK (DUF523 family)
MTSESTVELGSWKNWHADEMPLRLGVSSCLLGEKVRFDGGHARDRFVTDILGQWFEWVPVCPEVEIGMSTPRPTIRLVEESNGLHLVAPSTGEDFTARMKSYAQRRVEELRKLDLDGYVLKKSSPSCGFERIKVYKQEMPLRRDERGMFVTRLVQDWPALPIEEDGRLNDPRLRENFIERVFSRNRWRVLVARGLTRRSLVEFHTAHKLLIRAHDELAYNRMGRLVGSAGSIDDGTLFANYELEFQRALTSKATVKQHVNVLQHAMGYLKTVLDPVEKREILAAIEDYRAGLLPLVVPLTLLRYNIRRHQVDYLAGQIYFDPHPRELMLRNHC